MGELAEGAPGSMAFGLAEGIHMTDAAILDRAQAVLKSGISVGGVRGVCESACRQQDLQSYRQNEKHSRDRVASHPFTSAHPPGASSDKLSLYVQAAVCAVSGHFARFMSAYRDSGRVGLEAAARQSDASLVLRARGGASGQRLAPDPPKSLFPRTLLRAIPRVEAFDDLWRRKACSLPSAAGRRFGRSASLRAGAIILAGGG
jgi:hypothetical protein